MTREELNVSKFGSMIVEKKPKKNLKIFLENNGPL